MRTSLQVLVAGTAFSIASLAAHADSISVGPVNAFSPTGVYNDSLSLRQQETTFNTPQQLTEMGTLVTATNATAYTGNFSFVDAITINSISQMVTVTGSTTIAGGVQSLTFNATGPITFGDTLLNIESSTYSGTGDVAVGLVGDITSVPTPPPSPVPEPSSIVLLGTGLLGAAGVARRKFLKA